MDLPGHLIADRVAARIDDLLADERTRWSDVDVSLQQPLDALRDLVKGGKRLRPVFCHMGWRGAGGSDDPPIDAYAAIELVHAMAIIHDDVMDGSQQRHGRPSVHVALGEGPAILIGDLAFVYADLLMRDAPREAIDVFTDLRLEVNMGQYLDVVGTADPSTIAVYKSAKYTIERPMHIGAALAGRLGELRGAYSAFGLPLGEAFQLRDDLLGAFGDEAVLGKSADNDLRTGKPTALLATSRARATGAAAAALATAGRPDADVDAIRQAMIDTGAQAEIEARAASLMDAALKALATAPIPAPVRTELEELAHFVVGRGY